MAYEYLENHPAYSYAVDVSNDRVIAGKYIKKACQKFLKDLDNGDLYFDQGELKVIDDLTGIINMASGIKEGTPVRDALAPFQWFFIANALCWKMGDDHTKRRFEKSVLLIARKSGKSFLVALIFILLLLMEPKNSEFYSVAPDRELSSIVKKEVQQTIEASPLIAKYFKVIKTEIRCTLKSSIFIALANSENRMDGRKANVFVADEVGALRNRYPIDAMVSSQMNMVNRTGILISTAYESLNNPMTEEVEYAEKVLDGVIEDDTLFALLYMPDDPKDWTSDKSLIEANPLVIDIPENLEYLKKQRQKAIEMPSSKKNFLTKHMNIFVDGNDAEVYVSTDELKKGRVDKIDWKGRDVFIGVDLAQTTDNTAVSMVAYDYDEDRFYSKVWAFLPTNRADDKTRIEKVDYRMAQENGYAFLCGDNVISQRFVEDFVLNLEKKYGVTIKGIGYDRYNCISSANRWSENGYETIEVKQHSSHLHPATKLLKEVILQYNFSYETNNLYELNFSNAREVLDTNLNGYVNKKKSTGKIDMVAATINSMVLWNQEFEETSAYNSSDSDFIVL